MRTITAVIAAAGLVLAGAMHAPARADWNDTRHQNGHGGPPRQAEWHHDDWHRGDWHRDDGHRRDGYRDGWHGEGWHHEGWYRPSPWLRGYVYAPPPPAYYEPPPVYYVPPVVPLPPVLSFGVTIP
ncbi:MAG: hypothetical protein JSR21_08105 [Proteobacteria bacterium]|nr:hypothetical protein [Pseudomonadota bacterium]